MIQALSDLVAKEDEHVDSIHYHTRRDFERQHLRWAQDMEEFKRSGTGHKYAEPKLKTREDIEEKCYIKVPFTLLKELLTTLTKKRKRKEN